MHPILEALFNHHISAPSKQLQQLRSAFSVAGGEPKYVIILPPSYLVNALKTDTILEDIFLLTHVFQEKGDILECVSYPQFTLILGSNTITPASGFSDIKTCNVLRKRLFMPTVDTIFFILEIDSLLYHPNQQKKWFGSSRSVPLFDLSTPVINFPVSEGSTGRAGLSPDLVPLIPKYPIRNPAYSLSIKNVKECAEKVDYDAACLQIDAESSLELASRFHASVRNAKRTLQTFGGILDTSEVDENSVLPQNHFRLEDVYDYVEAKMGGLLLKKLNELLENERTETSFFEVYKNVKYIDLLQVDIPNLTGSSAAMFEQATNEAALVLGHLSESKFSHELCTTFLRAMSFLVDPKLGTVSADTLLGLFLVTILRTSPDAIKLLERSIVYVSNFSFQASSNALTRASAGRLSYTLMVVESCILHLRSEEAKLKELSSFNIQMWKCVRGDDRDGIIKVAHESPSSVVSRKNGKTALFMAIEDGNHDLFKFLVTELNEYFTCEFLSNDRDGNCRTLFMVCLQMKNIELSEFVVSKVDTDSFNLVDNDMRHIGFYISTETIGFVKYISDIRAKDANGDTCVLYHAKHNPDILYSLLPLVDNFYDHIDIDGNCLFHICSNNLELIKQIYTLKWSNINWKNRHGITPLFACENDDVSSYMLTIGADPWSVWDPDQQLCPSVLNARGRSVSASTDMPIYVVNGHGASKVIHTAVSSKNVTPDDFAKLLSELSNTAPVSWLPPLEFLHATSETTLGRQFHRELSFFDNLRISIFLKQLFNHPTFGVLDETRRFFGLPTMELHSESGSTLFGNEDESSMLMFLTLGIERLNLLSKAIHNMANAMCRIKNNLFNLGDVQHAAEDKLRKLSMHFHQKFIFTEQPTTLASMVQVLSFEQLAKHTFDLGHRLKYPIKLAKKLEIYRDKLANDYNRLNELASQQPKPSWLSAFENKRLTEIESVEQSIQHRKKRTTELELELRATHFNLANEFGVFNSSHEDELLFRIKEISLCEIERHKEQVSKLQSMKDKLQIKSTN